MIMETKQNDEKLLIQTMLNEINRTLNERYIVVIVIKKIICPWTDTGRYYGKHLSVGLLF